MTSSVPVAPQLGRIEPAWLTEVLRAGGHCEAAVTALAVEPVAFTGATTDMARLRIGYDGAGARGPATLIAKIRGATEVQRQMDQAMGLFAREAEFYSRLADEVPVRTPACVHIGDGDGTPLLLEDLGELRMGDQIEGMRMADAEVMMDALADLHARFWEAPVLASPWLASPAAGVFAAMITQLVASGAPALAERYAGTVPDSVLSAIVEAAPNWGHVLARCAAGPQTLVHNDCRLDNLFFAPDGTPTLIDWQIVARTRGAQDVGNLLAGSVDSDELAANWEQLLARYQERLAARGVTNYSLDQCIEDYRVNILFPLGAGMALIGAMDIGDGRGLGDVIVGRCLRHIAALDSFAAL
jgi:hypothetical protein